MQDCLDLGPAPIHEDCAQVESSDSPERARRECRAYLAQLRRTFGEEPGGARLSVKSNPHDFGSYLSVVCHFDGGNERAADYAFRCEAQGPRRWDEEALRELAADADGRKEKTP